MKSILLALLVACGDNTHAKIKPDAAPIVDAAVDATPDAPPIPPGAHTWQWAWDYYVVAWCSWFAACNPTDFPMYYGTVSMCVDDNSGFCDIQFGYSQCQTEYPPEREQLLMQCVVDQTTLACDAYPDVFTCDAAFTL